MNALTKPHVSGKSLLRDADAFTLAIELIGFGARLQVLESEVALSRDRLARLYRELRGSSPPKGKLPFSPAWFLAWRPNIHASLFLSAYRFLEAHAGQTRIARVVSAYRLYMEQVALVNEEPILSFTRAWTMVRFVEAGTLELRTCPCCGGRHLRLALDPRAGCACTLCAPRPARGQRKKGKAGHRHRPH